MPTKEYYANNKEYYQREARRYYYAHREERLKYAREWSATKSGKAVQREAALRFQHRLTKRAYDDLLAMQGGACAACGSLEPRRGKKRLCVDHDHATGNIRGILCFSCNLAIGEVNDSPSRLRQLADYLEREHIPIERYVKRKRRTQAEIEALMAIPSTYVRRPVGRPRKS